MNGAQVLESNATSKLLFGFGGYRWKIENYEQLPRMRLKFKTEGRAGLMQHLLVQMRCELRPWDTGQKSLFRVG